MCPIGLQLISTLTVKVEAFHWIARCMVGPWCVFCSVIVGTEQHRPAGKHWLGLFSIENNNIMILLQV